LAPRFLLLDLAAVVASATAPIRATAATRFRSIRFSAGYRIEPRRREIMPGALAHIQKRSRARWTSWTRRRAHNRRGACKTGRRAIMIDLLL
jgi:hypothetical protein